MQTSIGILGGGWLGAPLARALQEEGYPIKISTASETRYAILSQELDAYQVQVTPDNVRGTIESFLADLTTLVINIPPLKGVPEVEQFATLQPLVAASSVQQVLLVSSTGVYREIEGVVREDSGQEKKDHKLYQSEQLWQQTIGVETTILRLAGLIGGKRHPGRFFQRRGIIPAPEAPVNLIHRDDAVSLIQAIIEQRAWGQVFNGCADAHPTKGLFYTQAAQALGISIPALGDGGKGAHKIISNEKAKRLLGFSLSHPDPLKVLDNWS